MGCCLHNYIFDKLTDTELYLMQMEMAAELQAQIPEMGVQRVRSERTSDRDSVKLTVMGYNTWILRVSRDDLLDLNILDVFGGAS